MRTITLHDAPAPDGTPVTHAVHLPESWEELTADQLLGVVALKAMELEEAGLRFALFKLLGEVPDELMARIDADAVTEQVDEGTGPQWVVLPCVSWLLTDPAYVTSKLPTIVHKGITYNGPDNELQRMTMNQYVFTCQLLNAFRDSGADADLHYFLGSAYQPAGVPWDNEPIEEHAAALADLPMATKLLAVRNFEALHANLPERYPITFDPSVDGESSPQGLMGLAYDVAKGGALGDLSKVETTLLHKVLGYVEHNGWKEVQRERRGAPASNEE